MKRFFSALVYTLVASQAANAAADFQYYVYPVQGITGISQSGINTNHTDPKYSGMINEEMADLLFTPKVQQSLIQELNEQLHLSFPQAIVGGNQIQSNQSGRYAYQPYPVVQCSPNFTVNYKDAFAVAIGVNRFSVYINRYGHYIDALIPSTYTLRFIKLNGANVVFSHSETIYTRYSALASEFFAPNGKDMAEGVIEKLRAAIESDGLSMVARQVQAAAKGFSPKQTEITVAGRDGNHIILSHGSEVGFTSNESFDAQNSNGQELAFDVLYATHGLSIVTASEFPQTKQLSNAVRPGEKLSFKFSKQGRDDAKPSILIGQYLPANNQPLIEKHLINNALSSIVADDIGFTAPFNVIQQDADFVRLKEQIRADANCDSSIFRTMNGFTDNSTLQRTAPDYYLKLDSFNSPAFTAWGHAKINSSTTFLNSVVLSIIDRTGVINQSFIGNTPYTLERTAGKGLSLAEAMEINLKNAALLATKELVSKFTPSSKSVEIKLIDSGIAYLGQSIPLAALRQARIVRPLQFNGKKVLLPLPNDVISFILPNQDSDQIQIKGTLKKGDLFAVSGTNFSNRSIVRCDTNRKTKFLATELNQPSAGEEAIVYPVLTKTKGFNLFENDESYLSSIENILREGYFSTTTLNRPTDNSTACYVALEMQGLPKHECLEDGCSGTAQVASGIRIYVGPDKIAESIQGAQFNYVNIHRDALSEFVGVKSYENHIGSMPAHLSKLP